MSTTSSVIVATSLDQIKGLGNGLIILNFYADWAPPCAELNNVFEKIASINSKSGIKFVSVDAEKLESITESFEIGAVPTFVFVREQKVIDKVEGANGADLANKLAKYAPESGKESIKSRCERLVNSSPVMLFMKGSPSSPSCGFSRKMVDLLNSVQLQFDSFNILSDEEIRNGIKEYGNWPTYPQLYVDGKLVGGLDVTKAMIDEGEFWTTVPTKYQRKTPIVSTTATATTTTTSAATSTQTQTPAPAQPALSTEELNAKLKKLIESAPLMLFMKGAPENPKCGFSKKVVERLNKNGLKFGSFDILSDESVRSGLKTYSNWPTFPQLYHNSKLIGGCDIICEMDDNGELASLKN